MTEHQITSTAEPRAQKLKMQAFANRVIRGLLRTPLLCRVVGNRLVTLYVVGRKSGRRYVLPVAYVRDGDALLIGTPFGWVRNLRSGERITVRFKGKRRVADVEVYADEPDVVAKFAKMASENHQFAGFNRIGLDPAGNPDPTDLHLAWAAGARAVRLTL
ncbi:MAG TPA: nitroreductase/quinone reductase family protein [Acidothermaceae bacterium]|nr:nitroreductase/quinone reductase family protein [Acidothermaceae bacterium]